MSNTQSIVKLMIASNDYRCASDTFQGEVLNVCFEPGCNKFALICKEKTCGCKPIHNGHQMIQMDWLMERITQPLELTAHLAQLEKNINTMIDGFVTELQELKVKHREYVRQFLLQHYGGSALRKRLAARECLDREQATGDCFSRLVGELKLKGEMESPYKLTLQEYEQRVGAIGSEMDSLRNRIEHFWNPPKFSFSNTFKHGNITLSDSNIRATNTQAAWASVLSQPSLSGTAPSKVIFKMNKISNVLIGVGYRSIVQQKGYIISNGTNEGMYVLQYGGTTYSHSRNEDNGKANSSQLKYQTGDVVTVQLDPATGKVTYSKEGSASFTQETSIRSTSTDPVHFCLLMHSENDVSLL